LKRRENTPQGQKVRGRTRGVEDVLIEKSVGGVGWGGRTKILEEKKGGLQEWGRGGLGEVVVKKKWRRGGGIWPESIGGGVQYLV